VVPRSTRSNVPEWILRAVPTEAHPQVGSLPSPNSRGSGVANSNRLPRIWKGSTATGPNNRLQGGDFMGRRVRLVGSAALGVGVLVVVLVLAPGVGIWLLRGSALVLGALLLYIAVFLYENEEREIESKLEAFWVRVDDAAQGAVSRQLAIAQEFAQLGSRVMDGFFGSSLISVRIVVLSAFLSYTSFLVFEVTSLVSHALEVRDGLYASWAVTDATRSTVVWTVLLGIHLFVLWRLLRRLRPYVRERSGKTEPAAPPEVLFPIAVLLIVGVLMHFGAFVGPEDGMESPEMRSARMGSWSQSMAIVLLGGLAADILVLSLVRRLLRNATTTKSWFVSATATVSGIALTIALFVGPWVAERLDPMRQSDIDPGQWDRASEIHHLIWLSSFVTKGNLFDVLGAAALCLVGGALLVHRLIWRLAPRVMYAPIRHDLLRSRKVLGVVGFTLVAYTIPPLHSALELIAKLFGLRI
jgi:hypothetical protein